MSEFTIPFKRKWTPFRLCDECKKRKLSTTLYDVYDNGLNDVYVEVYCCRKCMREAERRVKEKQIPNLKVWCTKCDKVMKNKGIALDSPRDGIFYVCSSCNYRIIIFPEV